MIAHSDNTAPDIATEKVGADRLRAFIAEAGLSSIRIPESTRLFRSYILGAAAGVDLGWPGVLHPNIVFISLGTLTRGPPRLFPPGKLPSDRA
jgi:Beta-lactamase enzyme family